MNTRLSPTNDQDRIVTLDMLRGFALLGIILANSLHFQFGLLYDTDLTNPYPNGFIDQLSEAFILILVQASFYPLFSFLFGYGMAMQKTRMLEKGLNFNAVYWRRTVILGIVGYIHGIFLWNGDVLFAYAWTAALLFFFLMMPARGLIISGLIIMGLLGSCAAVPDAFWNIGTEGMVEDPSIAFSEKEVDVLSEGTYAEIVSFRLTENPLWPGLFGEILMVLNGVITVIGLFLVGAYVMRKGWIADPFLHKKKWKWIMWVGLIVALITKSPTVFFADSMQLEYLQMLVGGPFLTAFFVAAFTLAATTEAGRKLLQPFSFAGRMAFTNYLTQSLVMTFIFYPYGLGLFNSIGVFAGGMIAIAVFIIQVILSKLWLNYFRIGPLEWLWRAGTYMTVPKFKR
ncbi:DUF418 domain-containing protein [Alkalicoccobacillus porphyridii]|uniref:DUF418 domain-containing protein n=1 Tax=Alkalicoccobacillus porphyridii TaxID=2597270 RepID=A0A553ZWI4_9BACI|nr:DUF418 domain-containing protein [Alkalicoccobacillus porphyridii]TSB45828.1 DUF418 domain-containing protein [Alkalicoccobacillus porphyridii]